MTATTRPTLDIAAAVDRIVRDSLYRGHEIHESGNPPADAVYAPVLLRTYVFHPQRIASHEGEIDEIIDRLDPRFRRSVGGGWSFLNLPLDRDGAQWGEHMNAEALLALAIATKRGGFMLSREHWDAMPGGMPYVWLGE